MANQFTSSDLPYINVKDFGAKGDGVTDDTSAIQNAINSLGSTNSTIYLPYGTYKIKNTLTLSDSKSMIGFQSVLVGIGTNNGILTGNNNYFEGIEFRNFNFAIWANGKTSVSVQRCRFISISGVAIYYYGSDSSFVKNSYFYNIAKDSLNIDNNAYNIAIEGNEFNNPSLYGGYSSAQITAHVNVLNGSDIRVINNKVFNNGGQGIIFGVNKAGSTNCKAIGNIVEGNGQEGITCFGGSSFLTSNNIIIGNTCRNNRFHQIEIWQSNKCIVEGNIVEENATTGNIGAITLYQSYLSKVVNNTILNAANNGIGIVRGSDKCIVSNNHILETNLGNFSNNYQGNGILIDSNGGNDPTNITITNNTIDGISPNLSTKFGIYSTNNVDKGNLINNNRSFGYKATVHSFALSSCYNVKSAPPTSGAWQILDTVGNIKLTPGSYAGWICTTDGIANNVPWTAKTAMSLGKQVNANGNVYQCTVPGTTGTIAPSHTSGTATDGTVTWKRLNSLAVFKPYGSISS
ncbi:right-handed parallel beta-helix repeat-containing protein [Bacillus sp. RG28]|uniref:Right-handed parallel beta-helix repeat-containing protein n=1 Tax=Gottfriedia endophytica TaxID=2820819 RepID=A0A940NM88_9BACI|nr:right-handed parallel beta-helix repeat-containing protein [Gottfriedia endophytica]MBP0725136.1 right-handed parallel beta-helix repeat-containing protein [Gottfriedia endophytica]